MSWTKTRVDRVATVSARIGWKALTASEYQPDGYAFLSTPNIKSERIDFDDVNYISEFRYNESPQLKLQPGDVLLAKDGNTLGITNIVRELPRPATVNGSIAVLRSVDIEARFLRYSLSSSTTQDLIESIKGGMGVPHLFQWDIRRLPINMPSRDEQRRIADFLDAETARIDSLAVARRRMRDLLTLRWERTAEEILGLEQAPTMIPLKYVARSISVGIVITPANWYVHSGGIPALRGINVRPGYIDMSNMVQISHEGHRENGKSRLSRGDVVVVRTGQAGAAAVVPAQLDGSNCIDLLIIRPGPKIDPGFLVHYLNSYYARDKISEHSVGTIQSHFNVASMKDLSFPDAGLAEQKKRAAELDDIVSDLDALNSQIDRQLTLLAERRQALITAAVTGQIGV
jgi:type I restriction enzyme S subunit